MVRFHNMLQLAVLLLCVLSTRATYINPLQDRGYNASPLGVEDVDEREKAAGPGRYDKDEGRVEGRGYNGGPAEDNVSGVDDCMVDGDGGFGTISAPGLTQVLIEFKYQLETTTKQEVDLDKAIIESLEEECLNKVLPVIFADMCGRRERRQLRRKLEVVGATTYPEDVVLTDVQCTPEESGNGCYQIEGRMNIYTRTDGRRLNVETDVLKKLESSMNNGEFDNGVVHDDIAKVSFIPNNFVGIQSGTPTTTGESGSPQSGLRAPYIAFIAIGGVMLIVAGVIWKRRRDNADAASTLTGDTSTLAPGAAATDTEQIKADGDSTGIAETTLDFSTIQEE